jgi:hypothetical protein
MESRDPDFIIGGENTPYMHRWHVIRRNRFFNIYLHKFFRSDDDRALHDHPWPNLSILLDGSYYEHRPDGIHYRKQGEIVLRRSVSRHRIELVRQHMFITPSLYLETPALTLFITGPKVRD